MKNALVLLLLIATVYTYGQTEHNQGVRVGEGNVVLTDVKEESGKLKAYKAGDVHVPYFASADDSILVLNQEIDSLQEIAVDQEARLKELENNVDLPGPVVDSAVANDYLTVVFYYNKEIVATQQDSSRFDIGVNGSYVGFESMDIGVNTITFTMGDTIRPGNNLYWQYAEPQLRIFGMLRSALLGVQDIYGNLKASAAGNILNKAPDATGVPLLASWGLNEDWWDDNRVYELYKSTGASHANYAAEGTSSLNADGTIHFLRTNEIITLPNVSTIHFAYLSWYGSDYTKCLISNADADGGFEVFSIGEDNTIQVRTFNNAGDSLVATSNGALVRGQWNTVGIVLDRTAGTVNIFINGVNEDNTTAARTDFPLGDTIYFGADATNTFRAIGYIDWPRLYGGELSATSFANLYNSISIDPVNDDVAPSVDTSNVGSLGTTVLMVQFDQDLDNPSIDTGAFVYSEAGNQKPIADPNINGKILKFTVPEPTGGVPLTLVYTPTGVADLQDAYGNKTDPFAVDVANLVQSNVSLLAHYKLNSNGLDETGNNNGLENSSSWSTTIKAEGSASLYGDGASSVITPIISGLGQVSTHFIRVYNSDPLTTTDFLSQRVEGASNTDGGFEIGYDFDNGHIIFQVETLAGDLYTLNGPQGGPGQDVFIEICMIIDQDAGDVTFYVNGMFNYTEPLPITVPLDKKITIGRGRSAMFGYIDDYRVYDGEATVDQIVWSFENPGGQISGGSVESCPCGGIWPDCDPCPPSDVDFDVLWTQNFDHWATTKTLPTEYKISNSLTNSSPINDPEPMWNQDFFDNASWRDSDVGYENTLLGKTDTYTGGTYNRNYRDSIVYDPLTNDPSLKIFYIEGRANSYYGEAAWVSISGADHSDIWFGFNWQLNPEFEPVRGGKLLGYGGGNATDYQPAYLPEYTVNSLGHDPGFSGRTMWDAGGLNTYSNYYNNPAYVNARNQIDAGVWPEDVIVYPSKIQWDDYQPNCDTCDNGGAVKKPFIYLADGSFFPRWEESEPRWYNMVYHITLNTGPNSDGSIEGFMNGHLVHQIKGIRWIIDASKQEGYNRFRVAFFFGGSSANEAATKDSWVHYDDIWFGKPKSNHNNPGINEGTTSDPGTFINGPYWPKK